MGKRVELPSLTMLGWAAAAAFTEKNMWRMPITELYDETYGGGVFFAMDVCKNVLNMFMYLCTGLLYHLQACCFGGFKSLLTLSSGEWSSNSYTKLLEAGESG